MQRAQTHARKWLDSSQCQAGNNYRKQVSGGGIVRKAHQFWNYRRVNERHLRKRGEVVSCVDSEVVRDDKADAGTDLCALGTAFKQCFAGAAPFAPGACPAMSGPMEAVVSRLVMKDPSKRYGSANEVIESINALTGPWP